jgi:dihydroorotate dehydrogenase
LTIYPLFRALLFRLEPERAHNLTLNLIRIAGIIHPMGAILQAWFDGPKRPVKAFGLNFINPVGLAAGYDKDGLGWRGLARLGFGHIEVGTVTLRPQQGNPKPRLFRLSKERALINRMGFPGRGSEFVMKQIQGKRLTGLVLGVNIGKNKDTPLEDAAKDYLRLLRIFAPFADYLTINISSPNTVGLRRLQVRELLDDLLKQLNREKQLLVQQQVSKIPLLVKIAPDLSDTELDDALDVIQSNQMDGVIATNTTVARDGIHSPMANEVGGLSGEPLLGRSLEMVGKIYQRTGGSLPVVGVGGISNTAGVQKMLDAGAVLVQLYTGLIYEGPGLVKRILCDLQ